MSLFALNGVAPELPPDGDVFVAPGAAVIGNVKLMSGTSVWFNAVLRGDTEPITVGEGSNVQDGCVGHADPSFPLTIGRNCTIGHKAIVHGCTIEDGVLIGMGATVLNGAVIGAGSLIGAGALVTEGKRIPPGSLVVGAPGKVVRELDIAAREELLASAAGYRDRMRTYQSGLTPVTPPV